MASNLISVKTITEFREHLVGWTLREIDDEFRAAGIKPAPPEAARDVPGQRRSRVEQYYASLDLAKPQDVNRLLHVFENILAQAIAVESPSAKTLEQWLRKDGYVYEDGRLRARGIGLAKHLAARISAIDAQTLHDGIRRMEDAVADDPALAIGAAKDLIESICRTILDAKGQTVAKDPDLSELVKATTKILKLAPDDIPSAAKGAELVKRTLHNLAAIVGNVGELRTLYGTGHGKSGKVRGLQVRHARLVAGAAATLATFLWDTYEHYEIGTNTTK